MLTQYETSVVLLFDPPEDWEVAVETMAAALPGSKVGRRAALGAVPFTFTSVRLQTEATVEPTRLVIIDGSGRQSVSDAYLMAVRDLAAAVTGGNPNFAYTAAGINVAFELDCGDTTASERLLALLPESDGVAAAFGNRLRGKSVTLHFSRDPFRGSWQVAPKGGDIVTKHVDARLNWHASDSSLVPVDDLEAMRAILADLREEAEPFLKLLGGHLDA